MDYSLEHLHVLLEQEIGAYATYDYLGMTLVPSLEHEGCDYSSSSHVDDDDHPDHTGSMLQTLGAKVSGSRKRKRLSRVPDEVDIAFAKARGDREVWRQRVCAWCYEGTTSFVRAGVIRELLRIHYFLNPCPLSQLSIISVCHAK